MPAAALSKEEMKKTPTGSKGLCL